MAPNRYCFHVPFSSRRLTLTEPNYEVLDKKLLVIKVAFEEWCHYLEGACHLVQVYIDHKTYLCRAKALSQWPLISFNGLGSSHTSILLFPLVQELKIKGHTLSQTLLTLKA